MQTEDGLNEELSKTSTQNQLNLWVYKCPTCNGLCKTNHSPVESQGDKLITIKCPHCNEKYPATIRHYVIIKKGESQ